MKYNIFFVMLAIVSMCFSVYAVPDQRVDCGPGNGMCDEHETEDAINDLVDDVNDDFDDVDERIDEVDDKVNNVDNRVDNVEDDIDEVKDDMGDVEDDLDDLGHEVDRNDYSSRMRDTVITIGVIGVDRNSRERDNDLQDSLDNEGDTRQSADDQLQKLIGNNTNYIISNDARWSEDRVGGGIGRSQLAYYLTGVENYDYKLFETGNNFFKWLQNFFVLRTTYDAKIGELEDKIDVLQATVDKLVEESGVERPNKFEIGLKKSKRTGKNIEIDGYRCDPAIKDCLKVIGTVDAEPEEIPTNVTTQGVEYKSIPSNETEEQWHVRLCERGHMRWHCEAAGMTPDWMKED